LTFAFVATPRARAQDNGHRLHHADYYSKWHQPGSAASCCNGKETKDGQTTGDWAPTRAEVGHGNWWAKFHESSEWRKYPTSATSGSAIPRPSKRISVICSARCCASFPRAPAPSHGAYAPPMCATLSFARETLAGGHFNLHGDYVASLAEARTLCHLRKRLHASCVLPRDCHWRNPAGPRVLLLDHLSASLGAPKNDGARAISAAMRQQHHQVDPASRNYPGHH
jgi:hypothetical protein